MAGEFEELRVRLESIAEELADLAMLRLRESIDAGGTELPVDEIGRLETLEGEEINDAKKMLADAATALCHGQAVAGAAAETSRKTFEEGALAENLPSIEVPTAELEAGVGVLSLTRNGNAQQVLNGLFGEKQVAF